MGSPLVVPFLLSIATPVQAPAAFVVRDVRVFDGERIAGRRSVLVRDGVIVSVDGAGKAVPPGAAVVDGRGRTLLPGLMDGHVHLSDSAEADLRQAASLGVTTVFDMFSGSTRFERIKAIRAADPPGLASVLTAGTGASAPGGHPSQMGGPPVPAIADSTEAEAFVAARMAEGSDYLKIIFDDLAQLGKPVPMLSPGTLSALVAAAHARGTLAVVHIGSEAQARTAVEAGADGLVHLFTAERVSAGFATLVAGRRAFVVPTLAILRSICGKPNGTLMVSDSLLRPFIRPLWRRMMTTTWGPRGGPRSCDGTEEAIRQLVRHGAPIVAGTDAPAPGQTYGASLHGELELLVGAGLTPIQALAAATSAPARAFRLTDRGWIRPGLRADLVLIDGDPTSDIQATRRIVAIWKRGIPVERARYEE